MTSNYRVHDLMAEFAADNPYPDDVGNRLMVVARKYRNAHPEEFIYIKDWKENIHSVYIFEFTSPLKQSFGIEVKPETQLSNIPPLANVVKGFFNKYGNDPRLGISDQLKIWASAGGMAGLNGGNQQMANLNQAQAINNVFNPNGNAIPFGGSALASTTLGPPPPSILSEAYIPNIDAMKTSPNEIASYDFGSKYTISYTEIMKICMNKARQDLVMIKGRDVELEKAAEQRRNELEIEINKYFQVREIHLIEKRDLSKLTIAELEEVKHLCELKFDALKVSDLVISWLETGSTVLEGIFPDGGIPIGSGRHLRFKSIKSQLKETVLNPASVAGLAFSRSLDKRHIHVSDEFTVGSKIVQIFISNLEITKPEEPKPTVEELENSYEESSELLEIED